MICCYGFYLSWTPEISTWALPTCIFDKIGYFIDSIIYKLANNWLDEKTIFITWSLLWYYFQANCINWFIKCLSKIQDESKLNLWAPKTLNLRLAKINSWRLFCIWYVSVSISIIISGILTVFCSILFNAQVLFVSKPRPDNLKLIVKVFNCPYLLLNVRVASKLKLTWSILAILWRFVPT